MVLAVGTTALVLVVAILFVARVGRVASWRAIAAIAMATGSLRACVEFIRFCERQ